MSTIRVNRIAGDFLAPTYSLPGTYSNKVDITEALNTTGIDATKQGGSFVFTIDFSPFPGATRVYYNKKRMEQLLVEYNTVSRRREVYTVISKTSLNKKSIVEKKGERFIRFVCIPWLEELLGREPLHGEKIYYSLKPTNA